MNICTIHGYQNYLEASFSIDININLKYHTFTHTNTMKNIWDQRTIKLDLFSPKLVYIFWLMDSVHNQSDSIRWKESKPNRKEKKNIRDCLKYRFQSPWLVHMCQKDNHFFFYLLIGTFDIVSSAVRFIYCSFGNFLYISHSLEFVTFRFGGWREKNSDDLLFRENRITIHIDSQLCTLYIYWFRWFCCSHSSHIRRCTYLCEANAWKKKTE